MTRIALLSAAASTAMVLAACAPQPVVRTDGSIEPTQTGPSVPGGSCNVTNLGWATGQVATPETLQRIKAESGATTGRVLAPDTAATTDFRPDRVNVRVDDERRILRVTCG